MNTKRIPIDPLAISKQALDEVAHLLLANACVAIPTETVYGLAGNAWSEDAIKAIFNAKGRPSDNPLIVHVSDHAMLMQCINQPLTPRILALIEAFWPGPLTLVFNKSELISPLVSASLPTVGIRMPKHPVALAIIAACMVPLAAPSANLSGKPSPTKASHVLEDLDGRIAAVVVADQSEVGVESTVLDVSTPHFVVLRKGGISLEKLQTIDPTITYDDALVDENSAPKSPGQKYKHYAPTKPLTLIEGSIEQQIAYIKSCQLDHVLLISADEVVAHIDNATSVISLGSLVEYEGALNALFDVLRASNAMDVTSLLVTAYPDEGLGATLNDRLRKAASQRIILK